VAFEHVLTPIEVGGMTLRNRLMMTTHGTRLSQRRYLGYLAERADQVGLVGVSASLGLYDFLVGPRGAPGDVGDFDAVPPDPLSPEHEAFFARYTDTLREQAAAVQAQGARCVGQLVHLGAASHSPNLQPDLAPSDVPDGFRRVPPHTLTREEIDRLLDAYVVTARRIRDAGMDGIEIHAAHGYLVQQFLSPLTNHRTDEHGGSLENRMRFLLDLFDRLHDAVGDLPIGIRVSGSEEGGPTADDVAEIAGRVAVRGIAYVNVSGGTYTGWGQPLRAYVAPATSAVGVNVADAAVIRRAVPVPVIVAGRILDLATAERIVAAYQAATAAGRGSISVDGRMIDVPVVERAQQTLRRHAAIAARATLRS